MKRHPAAAVAAALLVLVTSCGSSRTAGAQTTEQRPIAGVTAVRVLTSGDLTITAGSTQTLSVTAGANQLVGLTSQVIDGTLVLDIKTNNYPDGEVRYALTVPSLRSVELSGSGNATGVGVLTGNATVTVTGSGTATLTALNLPAVVVDLTGSGDVELAGKAGTQRVTATGSGNYRGAGLVTKDTTVQSAGSGAVSVNVSGTLTAAVAGSGDVTYTGHPAQIEKSSTGSGTIAPG